MTAMCCVLASLAFTGLIFLNSVLRVVEGNGGSESVSLVKISAGGMLPMSQHDKGIINT
jgi:hypothetical protein